MHDIDQGRISGQEAFARLVDIHVGNQIAQQQAHKQFVEAEFATLGAAVTPRVTAVETFLTARVGAEKAKKLMKTAVMAANIEAYEEWMKDVRGQSTSFNHSNREQPTAPPRSLAERLYPNLVSSTARTN